MNWHYNSNPWAARFSQSVSNNNIDAMTCLVNVQFPCQFLCKIQYFFWLTFIQSEQAASWGISAIAVAGDKITHIRKVTN